MRRYFLCSLFLFASATLLMAKDSKPLVSGLAHPTSVAVSPEGKIYVAVLGGGKKPGSGAVVRIDKGKLVPVAEGLNAPRGLVAFQKVLFVADKDRIWKIGGKGKPAVFVKPEAFPSSPDDLTDLVTDEKGVLYALDSGVKGGAIYRIDQKGKVSLVTEGTKNDALAEPRGLLMDSMYHLLVADAHEGLVRVSVKTGKSVQVLAHPDTSRSESWERLARDDYGRLFLADVSSKKIVAIPRPGSEPVELAEQAPADVTEFCMGPTGKNLIAINEKTGTASLVSASIPGFEVDDSPLAVEAKVAFPKLKWTGWKGVTESGKVNPHRPLILTHAGDGSNRVFVVSQQGVVHVFPNDPNVTKTKIFLDFRSKVFYADNENEQGFLGLAFHPNYKETGEFYVFYTDKKAKKFNVLSRFRVSKDDPDRADPNSEEEIFRIQRPFWNHDGGTIAFGKDGYLYVALGDGGSANDPFGNGQKMSTILGKILRIDVDQKDTGKKYGIPKDNPFVGEADARPEIWALGLRNVWRMAFDRKTGDLWAGDVGQNLWEEINIIRKGGNYGWNKREALHPFGPSGVGPSERYVDPIWEYHHEVGKSITGGHVYRGTQVPVLQGHYLYADYVSGHVWALRYDDAKKRVTANHRLDIASRPWLSFGEDEKGEVYFMTYTVDGRGIYRFVPKK